MYSYMRNYWDIPMIVRKENIEGVINPRFMEYYKGSGEWEKFNIYTSSKINIFSDELISISEEELEEALKEYDKLFNK